MENQKPRPPEVAIETNNFYIGRRHFNDGQCTLSLVDNPTSSLKGFVRLGVSRQLSVWDRHSRRPNASVVLSPAKAAELAWALLYHAGQGDQIVQDPKYKTDVAGRAELTIKFNMDLLQLSANPVAAKELILKEVASAFEKATSKPVVLTTVPG